MTFLEAWYNTMLWILISIILVMWGFIVWVALGTAVMCRILGVLTASLLIAWWRSR